MSIRVDTQSLVSGALVCGNRGLGVLGSEVPSVGESGGGFLYNDLSLPADSFAEVRGLVTSWPSAGTLTVYEDSSFEFTGAPDGAYSFTYTGFLDGASYGSATVSLQVSASACSVATITDPVGTSQFQARVGNSFVGLGLVVEAAAAALNVSANPSSVSFGIVLESASSVIANAGTSSLAVDTATDSSDVTFSGVGFVGVTTLTPGDLALIDAMLASRVASLPNEARIAAEVLSELNTVTIPVNVARMNSAPIYGRGKRGDKWRGSV